MIRLLHSSKLLIACQTEELELIHRALWAGSDDQSLWFYQQYLTSSFSEEHVPSAVVPNLTTEEKLGYLSREIEESLEMLECADDCKWIYQSLIHLSITYKTLAGELPPSASDIDDWINKLMELDPLRTGRWAELRERL